MNTETKRKVARGAVLVLLGALFFLVQWQGQAAVRYGYEHGGQDLLSRLTRQSQPQPLEYYQGEIEQTVWGPIRQILAGLFLIIFFQGFCPAPTAFRFGLIVFSFLVLTKGEVLFYPPYADSIGGPFAEAVWLKRNNFNYIGLLHAPDYVMGGPRVYLFTLYPSFLALLMKLIPSVPVFLVALHLLILAMAAAVAALYREVLRKSFSPDFAMLGALLLLMMPLFQSQSELIGMEMPCVFFIMLAALALVNRRVGWAAFWAIIAAYVKGIGVYACYAVFLVSAALFFFDTERKGRGKAVLVGAAAVALALFEVALKFLIQDSHVASSMIDPLSGWKHLVRWPVFYAMVLASAVLAARAVRQRRSVGVRIFFLDLHYPETVMMAFGWMWLLMFLNFSIHIPRYRFFLTVFFLHALLAALAAIFKSPQTRRMALVVSILLASANGYGFSYRPERFNNHVLLERSLEYRTSLKLTREIANQVARDFSSRTIGAPFLMAQALALPEMGYVQKPLDVMVYQMPMSYWDIKNFDGLTPQIIRDTVWVGMARDIPEFFIVDYPVGPQDQVIRKIVVGRDEAVLFRGGFQLEEVRLKMILLRNILESRGQLPKSVPQMQTGK